MHDNFKLIEPLSYRRKDAARILGVSQKTLFNWEKSGFIHPVRVTQGKRSAVLYPAEELKRLLTNHQGKDVKDVD